MAEDVDTKNIVKRVKNIVSYFHSNTVATRALHEVHAKEAEAGCGNTLEQHFYYVAKLYTAT